MKSIGVSIMVVGAILFGIGVLLWLLDGIPLVGKLPGDFRFEGKNVSVFFPLATCLLLSLLLTLILNVIGRFLGK